LFPRSLEHRSRRACSLASSRGRVFPKGKTLFECQSAAISNVLATEQSDMAAENAGRHSIDSHWLAHLQFHPEAG
jgi:hypothetical protein